MGPARHPPWVPIQYVSRLRKVGRSTRSAGAAGREVFCCKAWTSAVFFEESESATVLATMEYVSPTATLPLAAFLISGCLRKA